VAVYFPVKRRRRHTAQEGCPSAEPPNWHLNGVTQGALNRRTSIVPHMKASRQWAAHPALRFLSAGGDQQRIA